MNGSALAPALTGHIHAGPEPNLPTASTGRRHIRARITAVRRTVPSFEAFGSSLHSKCSIDRIAVRTPAPALPRQLVGEAEDTRAEAGERARGICAHLRGVCEHA